MADGDVLPRVDQATSTRVGDGHGTDPFRTRPPEGEGVPAGSGGDSGAIPDQIGRYRVLRLLGEGAFGRVFLARDDELQRDVAIKVPQPGRVARPEDLAQYLAEARTLAQLEHPGIVPVHDVGRTPDGLCYVVSRYVEGANLATRLKGSRLSLEKSLALVADVAEALGHAHAKGLVHRDVKPANILLDTAGKPILADFGLALREEDFGTGETLTGTPAYMSPEQARGEGHRVDARSDLFSLGVVLFEMLTGRLPFQGSTISALIDKIATADAPSPRQFEPALPAEAERICIKALARRASDRYATAHDFVDDLRHLLVDQTRSSLPEATASTSQPIIIREPAPTPVAQPRVVPKGLRSFDAGDADFFLDLLPGPRDREGLPESLRFWKSRIEQPDPAQSFSVGLIYGPSGCGKSSLMKAGLLPRLSLAVRTVYVEATSDDTEARLCRGLRNLRLPTGAARETLRGIAPDEAGSELVRTLTELRRGAAATATAPRVYLSSSYVDLVAHRAGVLQALQTAGLDCSAMEHYGAADERPAEFCLADVRRCDLYVGIFAHRYGYVPEGAAASITELEYREARKLGRPTLIFLVAPQAAWPETLRETGPGAARLVKLRQELETDRMVAYFETADDLALKVTAAVARWLQGRGQTAATPTDGKTLLVIDQFEQWLYAHRDLEAEPLVAALRQCDGRHLQAVVMIRDDFYMPVTRFFEQIDIQLQAGRNQTAIDLFDVAHARKVLTAFGRAYAQLPEGEPTGEQQEFLNQVVEGLAEESKVISVRLALFAEMVKAKPWTVATLRDIGGVSGVGVTFLEETFSAKSAPVASRRHELAARGVLQALLPEGGTGIKGHRKSEADLLAASGYDRRPADFADLLRLLNTELRLITPVDEADVAQPDPSATQPGTAHRFYQLTHDYLVPALRDWLTRKQKETRRGRAELLLVDRAAVWTARPENRQLPSLWQWCQIRWLTAKKTWTPTQRKMMRTAGRLHGVRAVLSVVLACVITGAGLFLRQQSHEKQQTTEARALVDTLLKSKTTTVPELLRQLPALKPWAADYLRAQHQQAPAGSPALHAALALLPDDPARIDEIREALLTTVELNDLPTLRDLLLPHAAALTPPLTEVLQNAQAAPGRRFHAACLLATYATPKASSPDFPAPFVSKELLATLGDNPSQYSAALELLRPARAVLLDPLAEVFRDAKRGEAERLLATRVLSEYAADAPERLVDLACDADPKPFAILFPKLETQRAAAVKLLQQELEKQPVDEVDATKETLALRQANAAVALVRLGASDTVWPHLVHAPDPRRRTEIVHRLAEYAAMPEAVIARLRQQLAARAQTLSAAPGTTPRLTLADPLASEIRALVLTLGEFWGDGEDEHPGSLEKQPPAEEKLEEPLLALYRDDPDAGMHGAAEWCLRRWGLSHTLAEIDKELATGRPRAGHNWYVGTKGQTLVMIPGPVTLTMGSPTTEADREGGAESSLEQPHEKTIPRSFAIGRHEVTVAEFLRLVPDHEYGKQYARTPECPINQVTWYQAADYCNRLSKAEGLPETEWCYLPNEKGEFLTGMRPADNYLERKGYRLPTEAEWEFACRAGTQTSRYYGETERRLGRHAWYTKNSQDRWLLRAGTLKPNDLGLFDMQGNILEWCQDAPRLYEAGQDSPPPEIAQNDNLRVLRGGSFSYQASFTRSANRNRDRPVNTSSSVGFRLSRTYP